MRRYPLTLVTARSSAFRSAFVAGLRRLPLLLPTSLLIPNFARLPPPPSPEVCTPEVREPPSERHPKRGRSLSQAAAGMESPRDRKTGGRGGGVVLARRLPGVGAWQLTVCKRVGGGRLRREGGQLVFVFCRAILGTSCLRTGQPLNVHHLVGKDQI